MRNQQPTNIHISPLDNTPNYVKKLKYIITAVINSDIQVS